MPATLIDITGKRKGNLTVIGRSHFNGVHWIWKIHCKCGADVLMNGQSFRKNITGTHLTCKLLDSNHPRYAELHATWAGMMDRCHNGNSRSYPDYGGRGIIVCSRWHSFANFAKDMPTRPKPWDRSWSIDRINVNGNYEPSNVRWATPSQQQQNRRYNVSLPFDASHLTKQRRQQIANNLMGLCSYCKRPLAKDLTTACEIHRTPKKPTLAERRERTFNALIAAAGLPDRKKA